MWRLYVERIGHTNLYLSMEVPVTMPIISVARKQMVFLFKFYIRDELIIFSDKN